MDQLWEALKAEVCKSDKAELIVFLTKEKLRRALASLATASPAPKEEEAQTFKYRDCQLFKERGFHDWRWRWLGWPLGSIIPVNIDEQWCNVCGLRQRPLKGAWANIDYAPTPKPSRAVEAATRAAEELQQQGWLLADATPEELNKIAAIISRHFPAAAESVRQEEPHPGYDCGGTCVVHGGLASDCDPDG